MLHYQDDSDAPDFEDHSPTETVSPLALPILPPWTFSWFFVFSFLGGLFASSISVAILVK